MDQGWHGPPHQQVEAHHHQTQFDGGHRPEATSPTAGAVGSTPGDSRVAPGRTRQSHHDGHHPTDDGHGVAHPARAEPGPQPERQADGVAHRRHRGPAPGDQPPVGHRQQEVDARLAMRGGAGPAWPRNGRPVPSSRSRSTRARPLVRVTAPSRAARATSRPSRTRPGRTSRQMPAAAHPKTSSARMASAALAPVAGPDQSEHRHGQGRHHQGAHRRSAGAGRPTPRTVGAGPMTRPTRDGWPPAAAGAPGGG